MERRKETENRADYVHRLEADGDKFEAENLALRQQLEEAKEVAERKFNTCSEALTARAAAQVDAERRAEKAEQQLEQLRELVGSVIPYMSSYPRSWAQRWCDEARAALSQEGEKP